MRRLLIVLGLAALLASAWIGLTKGQMEDVHLDIIFFHVPSAICSLLSFVVLLVASIAFLATENWAWDRLALAAAEVGTVLVTILNATGMVFSRAAWGIWWTPSPRLVSSAILWFLYVVYLILRVSLAGSRVRVAKISAVFGIIAFLDVPMVYISARYLKDIHRPNFTFDAAWPRAAFVLGLVGTIVLSAALMWLRTDLLKSQQRLEEQSHD